LETASVGNLGGGGHFGYSKAVQSDAGQILSWIATQHAAMQRRVTAWASINSNSFNTRGLATLSEAVEKEFQGLGGETCRHALKPLATIGMRGETVQQPLGEAIAITKRPEAPVQVLLNIHLDTVYAADASFQTVKEDSNRLCGPGVADAKGGIAVMLTALEALERSPRAGRIGWRVFLNPDEEIGSPGSAELLMEWAKPCHFGLLFEPALPDGALVDRRRGSGNFTIVVRGRSAHAGRDFANGRSALLAASQLALDLHALNVRVPGITLNIGAIDGGGPANVVPDVAICRVNIRITEAADQEKVMGPIQEHVAEMNSSDGISAELIGKFGAPPKILDERTRALMGAIVSCGKEIGLDLKARSSGGVSDGNRLMAAGLPNIDSLGVRGDGIHSPGEYLLLDSLVERAQLSALLLLKIAGGDIDSAAFSR
jgi:glutamate carboxypeptidase